MIGICQAFARGDVPPVLSAFDSAIAWREAQGLVAPDQNPYRGPRAVVEGFDPDLWS